VKVTKTNPKKLASVREWKRKNKDRVSEWNRTYRKANLEKCKEAQINYWERIAQEMKIGDASGS